MNGSIEQDFQSFLSATFTEEVIEQLIEFLPVSKNGISYWQSIKKLHDLFLKLVENINSFPFLSEAIIQYIEEQSTANGSNVTFGRLSKEQYYSYIRELSFQEEEHLGRYILSWLLLSLYSITDQYVDKLGNDIGRAFTKKQQHMPLKEKMAYLLKALDLWEEFREEKTYYFPEIETAFTTLIEKRHKVAHQNLTPEWIKELFNRTFKQAVTKQVTFQRKVLELLGLNDEDQPDLEEAMKFTATIKIITGIFFLYMGFFDQLIEKELQK